MIQSPHETGAAPPLVIEGYASRFNECDGSGDVIRFGAFAASLQHRPATGVKMLWQHNPEKPIGHWLHMEEDTNGLYVQGEVCRGLCQSEEAIALVQKGILDGLSIGFKTLRARKQSRTRHNIAAQQSADFCREVLAVDLWEISLVTFPLLTTARLQIAHL
ncbi:HK97 family phage prohead protease [Polycladidibacter hongkongensis]|uniref:HK97 family phage prohead protease n=1 Tax=Polycladidibacter hongkongensis TaxID=1647556 RepID=UPI0008307B7D|nr:HK97 family phage prohead protease [Pseudovibrio hongkongensis]